MGSSIQSQKPFRAELQSDVKDAFGHLMEKLQNGLALDNLRLVERYVNQELHLLLKFRMGDGQEFIACLQRDAGRLCDEMPAQLRDGVSGVTASELVLQTLPITWRSAMGYMRGTGGEQQTVLVSVVQSGDAPEGDPFSTFVWFDHVDCVNSILPHALYLWETCILRHYRRWENRYSR